MSCSSENIRLVPISIRDEDWHGSGLNVAPSLKYRKEEGNVLMTHSTHFIYGYMVSDIW